MGKSRAFGGLAGVGAGWRVCGSKDPGGVGISGREVYCRGFQGVSGASGSRMCGEQGCGGVVLQHCL